MNAAINIGTISTTRFTAGTVASTVAEWASAAATKAKNAALFVYNGVVGIATTLIAAYRAGTLASVALEYAQAAATWIKNAAVTASTVVLGIAAVAHGGYATSIFGAAAANGSFIASLAPFLVTLAAVTAAIAALTWAWKEWQALGAQGFEIGDLFSGDMFGSLDKRMNEKAKAEAAARASAGGEQPTLAGRDTTHTTNAEVTLKDETGRAKVTKKPKGPGLGLKVQPSGGF
jgi:hypothetical protein